MDVEILTELTFLSIHPDGIYFIVIELPQARFPPLHSMPSLTTRTLSRLARWQSTGFEKED